MVMLQGCKGITGSGPVRRRRCGARSIAFGTTPTTRGRRSRHASSAASVASGKAPSKGPTISRVSTRSPACVGCLSSRSLTRSTLRTPWAEAASSSRSPRQAPGYLRPASRSSAWPTSRRRSARGLPTPRLGEGGAGDEALSSSASGAPRLAFGRMEHGVSVFTVRDS